jgi:hypothetical protein
VSFEMAKHRVLKKKKKEKSNLVTSGRCGLRTCGYYIIWLTVRTRGTYVISHQIFLSRVAVVKLIEVESLFSRKNASFLLFWKEVEQSTLLLYTHQEDKDPLQLVYF